MARRYVSPGAGMPATPTELAEAFATGDALAKLYPRASAGRGEFHRAYMAAFNRVDGGQTAAQLADQVGGLGPLIRSLRPRSSAVAALYRPTAPAAGSPAGFADAADFYAEVAAVGRGRGSYRSERLDRLQNSYGSGVPADGGFLVPEQWRSDVVLASLESAIIRPRALVLPMDSYTLHVPGVDDTTHASSVFGGITGVWGDEGGLAAESSAKFTDVVLDAKKLSSYATAPNELVADSPAWSAWSADVWPAALAWFEDDKFIGGTGVGEPLGLVNAPCAVTVSRTTGGTVVFADLIAMLTRLLPQSFPRCIWLASPDVLTKLLGVFLAVGSPATQALPPSDWLEGDPDSGWTLLGRPLFVTEHVAALGSAGDVVLADPSFLVVGDRLTATLLASPHPQWNQDRTVFRMVERVDSRVWLSSAVTPKNGSATVSPVVKLV